MFKQLFSKLLIAFAIIALSTMYACQKKEANPANVEERDNTRDNAFSETNFDDAENVTANFTEANGMNSNLQREGNVEGLQENSQFNCGTITTFARKDTTINGVVRPWRGFVIDFGDGSTPCADGKIRKGKIRVIYILPQGWTYQVGVGLHRVPNGIRIVTFHNYFVGTLPTNLVKVEGTLTVTNNTPTTANNANPTFTREVVGGKLTFADNTTFTWNSNRTIVWTEGWNSAIALANPFDDKYRITGSYSGTNRRGSAFTGTIDNNNPVIISTACHRQLIYKPVSGKVTINITPTNANTPRTILVDYGNGTCDRAFTITINGNTFTVNG